MKKTKIIKCVREPDEPGWITAKFDEKGHRCIHEDNFYGFFGFNPPDGDFEFEVSWEDPVPGAFKSEVGYVSVTNSGRISIGPTYDSAYPFTAREARAYANAILMRCDWVDGPNNNSDSEGKE